MAIGAIGAGLINTAVQAGTSIYTSARNRKANRSMAKMAYKKDLEQWNRANLYNSPEAQMQRFKEAGLNPNLMYGRGESGQASSSSPQYQAPQQDYNVDIPNVAGNIGQYQDLKVKNAQISNINEQTKNYMQDIEIKKVQQMLGISQHALNTQKFTQNRGLYPGQLQMQSGQIRAIDQELNNKVAQFDLTVSQTANTREQTRVNRAIADLREKGINPNDKTYEQELARQLKGGKSKSTLRKEKKRDSLRAENKKLRKEYLERKLGKDWKTIKPYSSY